MAVGNPSFITHTKKRKGPKAADKRKNPAVGKGNPALKEEAAAAANENMAIRENNDTTKTEKKKRKRTDATHSEGKRRHPAIIVFCPSFRRCSGNSVLTLFPGEIEKKGGKNRSRGTDQSNLGKRKADVSRGNRAHSS
ncbi:hypothetical protein CDAR_541181 [Caerostris darwini]|uniref:Uncharacterized protein n=1 Tax=Caerostris darwini TaxID=1538125 RepID=A0AAV4WC86_9ARAC|nr:hypothetical protein CDAR_541181 [Caerostris darwini]